MVTNYLATTNLDTTKMGKTQSKTSQQKGDTNIEISEHIEQNTLFHDAHELKL